MLSENEFRKYVIFNQNLQESAVDYVQVCRTKDPARPIGAYAISNVATWVSSDVMGHSISAESRTAEKAFIRINDYKRVLEIWCQTQPIKVCRTTKKGNKSWGSYFPDFLVIEENSTCVYEVKTIEEINKLLEEKPDDWVILKNGDVQYLPAMNAFKKIGLEHKVFIYSSDMRFMVENIELMRRSRKEETVNEKLECKILDEFKESFGWSLYELKEKLNLENYTPIIKLIDDKKLYINIDRDLLSIPKSCMVVKEKTLIEEACDLRDVNKINVDEMGLMYELSNFPSEKHAQLALDRIKRIKSGEKSRQVRRWNARVREGKEIGLSMFQSLIPRYYLCGNRKKQVSPIVEEYLNEYLLDENVDGVDNTNNSKKINKRGLTEYRDYVRYFELAEKKHPLYDPVSRKTFRKRLLEIPPEKIAFTKGGRRLSNSVAAPSDPRLRSLKPQLAWQTSAIDHYLADVYLRCKVKNSGTYVLRPWVTAMIDIYTSEIQAITISFQNPSRKLDAKIIRECVRRHGKLPNEIIVDRGSDFVSVYFASLLAHYGIDYAVRPAGHSRYGGEIERFFGEFIQQWLCQRPGNLVDYKNVRSIDGKLAPSKMAILEPYNFIKEINSFCSWRDNKCRGFSTESASVKREVSEKDYPFMGVSVEYNDDFMLATAVETKEYKIDFQRGLHIGSFWYWHPEISNVRGKKTKLVVRIDPENPHVVYALIDQHWVACSSSHINTYSAKDPVSQLLEGLVYMEISSLKQSEKLEADIELARIIREKDLEGEKATSSSVEEVSDNSHMNDADSIFENFKGNESEPVSIEYWGETHDA